MADRVGIELSLLGYDGVFSDAKKLQDTLNKIGSTKYKIQFDTEIHRLETELRSLKTERDRIMNTTKDQNELSALNKKIREVNSTLLNLKQMGKNAIFTDQTWERYFNRMQAKIVQTGSKMQTLGKSISAISAPLTRFFSGMIMGAGFAAINKITSGFSGMFERYDTMKNYSRSLMALGYDAEGAQKSIEALNEAVLGLPTGLDEIVAAQKVYVGATGDLTKATDLAIAANNTFLASGTQSREQRFIQKYLSALGSGADLTAAQWQSMARIAPLAMRAVAEELGYAKEDYAKFNAEVQDGTVSGEKFLEAFIKVGKSGVVSDAAQVMKMSWEGLSANLANATKRMGESALKALDEVFESYHGRNLVQTLLGVDANGQAMGDGIKDWINSLSTDLQNWIKANPTKITNFFENLKKIDVAGFLKGMAEAFATLADAAVKLTSKFDVGSLGKLAVYGTVFGRFLTVAGGFTKGFGGMLPSIAKFFAKRGGLGLFSGIGTLVGGLVKGVGGKLKDLFTLFRGGGNALIGKGFEDGMSAAASAGKAASVMASGWAGVASKALTIAAIPVIVFSIKEAVEALKDLGELNISWKRFGRNLGQLAIVFGAFATVAGVIGAFPVASAAIATGAGAIAAVGLAIGSIADGMKKFVDMEIPAPGIIEAKVDALSKIVTPLQDLIDLFDEGGVFANIHKILENISTVGIIASIGKIIDASESLANKAKQLSKVKIGEKTLAKLDKLRDTFEPLADTLQGIIDEFDEGGVLDNIHKALQNWSAGKIIDSLGDMSDKITNMFNAVKVLGQNPFDTQTMGRAGMWLIGLEELFGSHAGAFNRFSSKQFVSDLTGFVDSAGNISEAFGAIETIIEHMDNIKTSFDKYVESGSFASGASPFSGIGERLQQIADFMKYMTDKDRPLKRMKGLGKNIDVEGIGNMQKGFDAIGKLIVSLHTLNDQMAGEPLLQDNGDMGGYGLGALRALVSRIVPLIVDIENSFNELGNTYGFEAKVDVFTQGLKNVRKMFKQIRKLAGDVQGGIFTEVETIKAAIAQALSIGETPINVTLQINFETEFGDSYNRACESIKSVVTAIIDYTKVLDAHTTKAINIDLYANISGLAKTLFDINNARWQIERAIGAIPTHKTKRVKVNIVADANTFNPEYKASGGRIFQPRGTDTVPAMLTPGEWVMKSKAVKKFGTEFMDRVNNLDISGAIRALHSRVGSTMTSTRRTVINNNNTDNRTYSNVQNINTNNPNFAFRRSRWVSELR